MKEVSRKIIDVTCALIIDDKRQLLATQRSSIMSLPLKWELPGGKMEPYEKPEQCLIREIKEELNIEIEITKSLAPNIHDYPFISIKLIPFICKCVSGEIELREHADFKWLNTSELLDLDWADADIPILNNYLKYLNAI
ncbi:(deoxy)nucleoside triphosphate pyrophosphohydrolase [Mucilaginibacter sp. OK098]|uniref:(deoxy)nucleoside triphosphate pyrophosphohydrolase n=1 Tax=Mucilaginibacter sp. OK098 TaxID=1855297 RepID=UPI0009190DA6|nr:(deoxy)nucleoside triphosphate pyrophosphohydrolase [Mucilaginibacter sp. OK098]SHN25767.1 8-oxo-dGTP diphosphatase [Mucilaginibacter sp. OK098]